MAPKFFIRLPTVSHYTLVQWGNVFEDWHKKKFKSGTGCQCLKVMLYFGDIKAHFHVNIRVLKEEGHFTSKRK